MDATELFHEGGRPAGVWYCGKCRCITGDRTGGREAAEKCCAPPKCRGCGADVRERYVTFCDECWRKRAAESEAARFEKAEKVAYDGGPVFTLGDKFFMSLDDLEDHYHYEPDARPEYVWLAKPTKWKPDLAGYVLDGVHDNHHEDAGDQISSEALNELNEFGKAWWEKHGVKSWEIDYKRCVVLQQPASSEEAA